MSYVRNKYTLDSFQVEAFNNIDLHKNILVSAPTGSGKTAIADYSIEIAKNKNSNAKIIYTCPIKALCNEKYRDMVLSWGSEPHNYTIGLMTGDIIINPYGNDENENENINEQNFKKNGDIVIMTTEVLQKLMESSSSALIKNFNPDVIIYDEVHYINDDSRGHVWEKCIIYGLTYTNALHILLSATIGNINELSNWLNSISKSKFESIVKIERPVPLRQFILDNSKSRVFKKNLAEDDENIRNVTSDPDPESYDLLELNEFNYNKVIKYWSKLEEFGYSYKFELETICNQIRSNPNLGIPAIIFVFSKKKCEEMAHSIEEFSYINLKERDEILIFFDKNLKEFNNCSQFIQLRKVIQKGIGYHHSGLIPKIREVVEFLIKKKLIKIVFATETFAVGLNFPVKTVIITSLSKPTENGFRFLTVSEYKQMAGRAGRRFLDPFGNVILMLFNPKSKSKNIYPNWNEVNNIVNGTVDSVQSKFIIEPNYILKNISSEIYKQISLKSFKYYKSVIKSHAITCPEKFIKLFDIEKKIKEFSINGITYKDKNYFKLFSKLSINEKKLYKDFLTDYFNQTIKTDLELYFDIEESIINFLFSNNFIERYDINSEIQINSNIKWKLTSKGFLASEFNEINPIIFVDHYEYIISESKFIIPILSMFIDDGIKYKENEIIEWKNVEPKIIYWENSIKVYSQFINCCPKWTYYPKNYLIIKKWLSEPNITLDEITLNFSIDIGLFVKILIKLYQITDELLSKLDKLNLTDLTDNIIKQKDLLIRYPLKIDSLYINL